MSDRQDSTQIGIRLDGAALSEALNSKIHEVVVDAVSGYESRKAVTECISRELLHGVVAQALRQALKDVDTSSLAAELAKQIERTATSAVVAVIVDSFAETIATLRGIESYDSDREKKLQGIRAELDATIRGRR